MLLYGCALAAFSDAVENKAFAVAMLIAGLREILVAETSPCGRLKNECGKGEYLKAEDPLGALTCRIALNMSLPED